MNNSEDVHINQEILNHMANVMKLDPEQTIRVRLSHISTHFSDCTCTCMPVIFAMVPCYHTICTSRPSFVTGLNSIHHTNYLACFYPKVFLNSM